MMMMVFLFMFISHKSIFSETWLCITANIDGLAIVTIVNKSASETKRGFVCMDEECIHAVGRPVSISVEVC